MKPTKQQATVLADKISEYLTIKELNAANAKQEEALKNEVNALASLHKDQFVEGVYVVYHPKTKLPVGKLVTAKNAAKLGIIDSDRKVTDGELMRLVESLDSRYTLKVPNIPLMRDLAKDEGLQKVLSSLGMEVVQKERIDIKS